MKYCLRLIKHLWLRFISPDLSRKFIKAQTLGESANLYRLILKKVT